MAGGKKVELQAPPLLPFPATTTIPAARTAATAARRAFGSAHPSSGSHTHELLMTWGAFEGSGSAPPIRVRAIVHWRHSRQ